MNTGNSFTLGSTTMELCLSPLSHVHTFFQFAFHLHHGLSPPQCWQCEHANKQTMCRGALESGGGLEGCCPEEARRQSWAEHGHCFQLCSAWWTQQKTSKKLKRNQGCCLCPNFFRCLVWKQMCSVVWYSLPGWGDTWAWQPLPSACFLPQGVEVRHRNVIWLLLLPLSFCVCLLCVFFVRKR